MASRDHSSMLGSATDFPCIFGQATASNNKYISTWIKPLDSVQLQCGALQLAKWVPTSAGNCRCPAPLRVWLKEAG